MSNVSPPPMETALVDRTFGLLERWKLWINGLYQWINGVSFQTTSVTFSASTSASVTLSNQAWITAQSKIITQLMCPSGMAPATFNAMGLTVVLSTPTAGSVTITVFSPAPISGSIGLSVIGSS